jgi:hypothetical protein
MDWAGDNSLFLRMRERLWPHRGEPRGSQHNSDSAFDDPGHCPRTANAASLNLAASCQRVPVTFSLRTGSCPPDGRRRPGVPSLPSRAVSLANSLADTVANMVRGVGQTPSHHKATVVG